MNGIKAPLFNENEDVLKDLQRGRIPAKQIPSGDIVGNLTMADGYMKSANFYSGRKGWKIDKNGYAEFQNVNIGSRQLTIDPSQDIQVALDKVHSEGSGTVFLKAGTYYPTSDLNLYTNVNLIGESNTSTIIDFGGQD
jgi:hypothetical protein